MPEASATMIKRFRRRFMLITMLLVAVISLVMFLAIGVMGYQQSKDVLDEALSYALEARNDENITLPDLGGGNELDARESGVPVCLVSVYDSDPFVITVSQSSTATIASDSLESVLAETIEVVADGDDAGLLRDYGLFFQAVEVAGGYRIAYADASFVMDDFGEQAMTLVGVWLLLMVAMFFVTMFLSRYVARPIENAWQEQQRFIADASHELKTPLTIMLANVSILKQNPEKTVAEQDTWVEGIGVEAERMQKLTEELLTLAQEDAGVDQTQVMAELDLSSLIEGQLLQFDAVAFERELVIDESIAPGVRVLGDELRLENMVKTMLENACKYAGRPGTISVTLRATRGDAVLAVANSGEGIPAEDLPHIFDRFYRSDKARTSSGESASFGLGLSIAKSTAEAHGGTIEATSADGLTTFTVKLPLAKER